MTTEQRLAKLEKEMELYRRVFVITPTKLTIKQSVLVEGLLNGDRVYTKRSDDYVELTT